MTDPTQKDEPSEVEKLRPLREAWRDGIDSGDAGKIDFSALKLDARGRRQFRIEELSDEQIERAPQIEELATLKSEIARTDTTLSRIASASRVPSASPFSKSSPAVPMVLVT